MSVKIQDSRDLGREKEERRVRLPVRVRLKKGFKQFESNPQIVTISEKLKQENSKLKQNISKLPSKQILDVKSNLKPCLQKVVHYCQRQSKHQSEQIANFVKLFKKLLKNLSNEAQFLVSCTKGSQHALSPNNNQQELEQPATKESIPITQDSGIFDQPMVIGEMQEEIGSSSVCQKNKELKIEISQMQEYILSLKKSLNEKQNQIKNMQIKQQQWIELNYELQKKQAECRVLNQQIIGYQNKIDNLQQEVAYLKDLNIGSKSQDYQNYEEQPENNDSNNDINLQKQNSDVSIYSIKKQQIRSQKLEQIYQKTGDTLKRLKNAESLLQIKSQECQNLQGKLEQLISFIGRDSTIEVQNVYVNDINIQELMMQYNYYKEQQYLERQKKLEQMISTQIDKILVKTGQGDYFHEQNSTIADKLDFLQQLFDYASISTQQGIANPMLSFLVVLNNKVEKIMEKSENFKADLTKYNKKLLQICEQIQNQPDDWISAEEIEKKLRVVESLIRQNQETLQNCNIEPNLSSSKNSEKSINEPQVQHHLDELQSVVKSIQKESKFNYDKYTRQNQFLKGQVRHLHKLNCQLFRKLDEFSEQVNKNKIPIPTQIIESIRAEVKVLREKLNRYPQNLDQIQQFQRWIGSQRRDEDLQKVKQKFQMLHPQFLESFLNKLINIKIASDQQQFINFASQLLTEIQSREEKIKSEVIKRKQILKKRGSAIVEICKQGMKDSSLQNSTKGLNEN